MAQGIEWEAANKENIRTADLLFYKGVMDLPPHPRRVLKAFMAEVMKRVRGKPFLTLMGGAQGALQAQLSSFGQGGRIVRGTR